MKQKKIVIEPDGFVALVDIMGDDKAIVDAARISYHGGDASGNKVSKSDRELIRYLMRNDHSTPLEMVEIKFHVRIPMDSWRQMIRHRTASVNEYSTRYSVAIDSAANTAPDRWRSQSGTNKQGSGEFLSEDMGRILSEEEGDLHRVSRRVYEDRLNRGVAREQARKDLPLSTYTEAIWKIDLRNLFNFLRLRMDKHAQYEIRQYANAIAKLVKELVPVAFQAFEDYILHSQTFSLWETAFLYDLLKGDWSNARRTFETEFSKSERRDLLGKLQTIIFHRPTREEVAEWERACAEKNKEQKSADC